MEDEYKISIQFLINSDDSHLLRTSFTENMNHKMAGFAKKIMPEEENEERVDKNMILRPTKNSPEDHYNSIYFNSTNIVLNYLNLLKESILSDPNVENYVSLILDKLILGIEKINRIKMERIMIIIRCGIHPTCSDRTIEILSLLDHNVSIFYPPDRKNLSNDNFQKLQSKIFKIIIAGNGGIEKLIDTINFDLSLTEKFKGAIKNSKEIDRSKFEIVLNKFSSKIILDEPAILACRSIDEIVNIVNENNGGNFFFPNLCVLFYVKNQEIFIEYYGTIAKKIGGSFSFDSKRKLSDNKKFLYIFYFITCHYCLMNEDNILNINFPIHHSEVNNIFIFLQLEYLEIFRQKLSLIDFEINSNEKIFKCLVSFINTEIRFHIQNL